MSKENEEKVEKLAGTKLVEAIKDAIYEVLEEELDKLEESKNKINLKETIENLRKKKDLLEEQYKNIKNKVNSIK